MIANEDVGKSFLLCMILSKVTSFKLDPFCSQACLTGRWGLWPSDSKPQGHLLQLVASWCVLQCTFWRRAECLPGEVRSQCLVSFLHRPLLFIFESESDFSWNLKLSDWAKLTGPWASRTCLPPPPTTTTMHRYHSSTAVFGFLCRFWTQILTAPANLSAQPQSRLFTNT